ncbi:MAG TPA: hypothetical protein ENK23_03050 [Sorangium sp.]|nr:hypothetical protein [Sorangium sp.]
MRRRNGRAGPWGWLAFVVGLGVWGWGCSGAQPGVDDTEVQKRAVNAQLAGVWHLEHYTPNEQLSVALLLSMQSERIVVRFEGGRVKSANALLTFDRPYRIDSVYDNGFKMFIHEEDTGVEYEVVARFERPGRLLFQARTAPWRGQGVLQRDGGAAQGSP